MLDQLVADRLLHIGRGRAQPRHPIDHVAHQVETVEPIAHHHVERRGRGAFLLEAAYMEIVVVAPLVGQPVDQRRIAMIGENHRFGWGKQRVEILIGQAMRMLPFRLQCHQVHHIDHAHLQIGQVLAQQIDRRQRLHRRHVAAAAP